MNNIVQEMKSIVFIGAGLSGGGAEHQCSMLMNMLVQKDYNVTYASFGDVDDHYFVSEKVRRVQLAPQKSKLAKLFAVELFLLRVKTDVLIAFSQRLSVLVLLPMLFRPKVKVISSERNYTIGKPDIYENILIKFGVYKRANFIVPNNYSQGVYLSRVMPSIKDKIHVITNYTDTDMYSFSPVPNNSIPHIGVFCRFEEQKNFHRLLDAMNVLSHQYHYDYHIDWYGNHCFCTEAQRDYYNKGLEKIRDYKIEEFITIHEPTKEVARLIPSFDALCLPSLFEGFSNSISEYICCGRPVICSDVSDNSIMVHEGENGFLFNPLDVNDIVKAFQYYFSSSMEERISMGEKSREIAETLFCKDRFINDYIGLIEI